MKLSRSIPTLGIAATAFFALAASSPQCARTNDLSVNPTVGTLSDGSLCVQNCIDDFQASMRSEKNRFKEALAACDGDEACRDAEEALHESIIGELTADKDTCIENCGHEQGGGSSGQ
jgi:hypothetical protein